MSLYFWIDLLSISVPLLVSFHPRLPLYKEWRVLFLVLIVSLIPYIIWDVYFTVSGYWGFNEVYLSGISFLHLPIEEWLFFISIPYACVFTHFSLLELNPKIKLGENVTKYITYGLLLFFVILGGINYDKAYTLVDSAFAFVILLGVWRFNKGLLRSYYLTFLVMLIPFFIVNGILTGTGIEDQVVWYNDNENLGIRLGTIPVEDTIYAFSLILLNLFLFVRFRKN